MREKNPHEPLKIYRDMQICGVTKEDGFLWMKSLVANIFNIKNGDTHARVVRYRLLRTKRTRSIVCHEGVVRRIDAGEAST